MRKLTVSDETGVWLQADQLTVDWRAAELFHRTLHATKLAAQDIRVIRRPTLEAASGVSSELPLSFVIDKLTARVILEPAFSSQRGDFDLTSGNFDVQRLGGAKGASSPPPAACTRAMGSRPTSTSARAR